MTVDGVPSSGSVISGWICSGITTYLTTTRRLRWQVCSSSACGWPPFFQARKLGFPLSTSVLRAEITEAVQRFAAQQREAIFNGHILSVIGCLPDYQQRVSYRSLKYLSFFFSADHSPDYFFCPLQPAFVGIFKNGIQRLFLQILFVDPYEDASRKITGDHSNGNWFDSM